MKTARTRTAILMSIVVGLTTMARAHCQIPCGIYGDDLRFAQMREHITTLEKSMKEVLRLGSEAQPDHNQLVRWVANKDVHAVELTGIVTYYFMAQRVKPAPTDQKAAHAKYLHQVTLLHQMVVLAMKAKQTTDLEVCAKLSALIDQFEKSYRAR